MSHQKKIEQVLELLINEEHEAASDLLHSVIVDKARGLYEELVEDEDEFDGDMKGNFADDIEADDEEIEGEEEGEEFEGEEDEDAAEDAEEEEIEDRVEDLESEFAELKAEFMAMVGDEEEMPMDGEMDEFGGEEMPAEFGAEEPEMEGMFEEEVDDLDEATKLQDEQKADLKSEDQLSAKGGSEKSADKKSMFTNAPKKKDHGGKAHKIGGKDESGYKSSQGKDHTPEDNIDVPQKKQAAKKEAGDDSGADSILGRKGAPKGA